MHRDDIQLILNQIFKVRPDLKSVKKIEAELQMGQGTLAKAMKQTRDLPEKWILPLQILANPARKNGGEKKTGELETRMEVSAEGLKAYYNRILSFMKADNGMPPFIDNRELDNLAFDGKEINYFLSDESGQWPLRFPRPWIKQIEDFCKKHGITPQEFTDQNCVDLSQKTIKPDTDWLKELKG